MKKKLFIIIACAVMLVGCGSEQDETTSKENASKTETTTSETTTEDSKEAPIVEKIGSVDDERYNKAINAFESIVKKMRADGLVKETDVCVKIDNDNINVDITFDNSDIDLYVKKDSASNVYTLTFDYNFCWIEGIGPKVNGMEPAPYHKELLIATLSMISDDAKALFDRIDLDCFSAAGLSNTEWEEIGDCLIKSDTVVIDEYISYNIKKK